jgi:hypothetical protein
MLIRNEGLLMNEKYWKGGLEAIWFNYGDKQADAPSPNDSPFSIFSLF